MTNKSIFEENFGKLMQWGMAKNLLGPHTRMISAYYDDPNTTPHDQMRLETCMLIPEGTEADGEFKAKELPGGKFVYADLVMTKSEDYAFAWNHMVDWARQNGHVISTERPSLEIYKNNPKDHPEGHHLVEICLAVD